MQVINSLDNTKNWAILQKAFARLFQESDAEIQHISTRALPALLLESFKSMVMSDMADGEPILEFLDEILSLNHEGTSSTMLHAYWKLRMNCFPHERAEMQVWAQILIDRLTKLRAEHGERAIDDFLPRK